MDTSKIDCPKHWLLADFPEGTPIAPRPSGLIKSYSATVSETISRAKESIRICTPYLDETGVEFIKNAIGGSKITIFGDIVLRGEEVEGEVKNQLCGLGIKVYQFDEITWGFHSKYLVVDEKIAIVGSQNLTDRSLKRSLEVGTMFTGEGVEGLLMIHRNLVHKSKPWIVH